MNPQATFCAFPTRKHPRSLGTILQCVILILTRCAAKSSELNADLLALSTGIVPEDQTALENMLKVPVTAEKFFLEAHEPISKKRRRMIEQASSKNAKKLS
ncbi:MAG TPA: hypothetical protein VLS94_06720, partial [Fusibacter sp.]|nr:hypothetical protein [Fusibacter sp.]